MRRRTITGQRMLDRVGGVLSEVGRVVRASHERYDGGGYPDGLAADAIPHAARMISVADSYSAMTTSRPYRAALPIATAEAELRDKSRSQFDPEIVDAALRLLSPDAPDPEVARHA
jgi:HD-GYP domain-containing protein (c-di-GMP phosphodiesterase class II)